MSQEACPKKPKPQNRSTKYPRKFALKSQKRKTGQRDASPAAGSGNRAGFVWIDEGLVLIGQELEKMDGWMTGQKSEIRSAKKKEKMSHDTVMRPEKIIVVL